MKMDNKKIFELVVKTFKKKGFTIYGSKWFDFGFSKEEKEDALTFKVKELKGWRFGIWFVEKGGEVFSFSQAENAIDKFKPSYSNLMWEGKLDNEFLIYNMMDEVVYPVKTSYYLFWFRDYYGRWPKNYFYSIYAYYFKYKLSNIFRNFMGIVGQVGYGRNSEYHSYYGAFPFKFIYLYLKYGKNVNWNGWRKE